MREHLTNECKACPVGSTFDGATAMPCDSSAQPHKCDTNNQCNTNNQCTDCPVEASPTCIEQTRVRRIVRDVLHGGVACPTEMESASER